MASSDRDRERNARNEKALERVLPGALAEDAAAADAAACPDAGILAAFYERSLAPAEVTHWRAHFATCRRCQLALAALAASDPRPLSEKEVERLGKLVADATAPQAAGESPLRAKPRKIKLPWFLDPRALAPMAAAAAFVAAIGLTIHTKRLAMTLESQTQNSPQPVIVAENRVEPLAPAVASPAPTHKESRGAPSPEAKKISQSPPPAETSRFAAGITSQSDEIRRESAPPAAEQAPRPAAAAAPPPTPAEARDRSAPESGPTPPVNGGAAAGASPAGGGAGNVESGAAAPSASASAPASRGAEPAAPAPAPAESRAAASHVRREEGMIYRQDSDAQAETTEDKAALGNAPGYFNATSPDGQTQWRFGRRGLIERTTNASAPTADRVWTRQISPLRVDLLAGSAPSSTVCWIVGRAGAILRTTDGATWQVIPSLPAAARDGVAPDWVTVSARDANSATITSADGRVFSTTDAGQTWQSQ